jgi:hypothetical protein
LSRFEPLPRDPGIGDGLAARIHDPLWLLGRQWQLGEFRGEDAGTPAIVDLQADTHRLDRWRAGGDGDFRPYDPTAEPLERLVEQGVPDPAGDARLRVEGGARLARLLAAAELGRAHAAFLEHYGFEDPVPLAPRGVAAALHRRLADGARLAEGLRRLVDPSTGAAEAHKLDLTGAARTGVTAVAIEWLAWWDARVPPGAPQPAGPADLRPAAWDEHRLEYAFATRASTLGATELAGAEYVGGSLDWWSVDAAAPALPDPADAPQPLQLSAIPTPARFGGMPVPRFWEMEDARFDPGSIDAAPTDLGRLLLVSFASVYGNDWLVVPVRLPIGTLTRVRSFTVTDVFGGLQALGAAAADDPEWNLFALTDHREQTGASPWFLMAPRLPASLEGPPFESVVLARDEMANLAWAVEQRVLDAAGQPLDRYDQWVASRREEEPTTTARYRVDTVVPDHWFPLAPEQLADMESVRLRLVPVERMVGEALQELMPLGALLSGASPATPDPLWIHEEEVPRSGASLARSHQRARWHDGSVHAWIARRKRSGAGESSSGLRFDSVEEPRA